MLTSSTPTVTILDRQGRTVSTMEPVTIEHPAPVRLRDALTLTHDASDDEVNAELASLPCSAACDACRHDEDVDNRSHFACQAYHPAWDIAEEIGLADVVLDGCAYTWQL